MAILIHAGLFRDCAMSLMSSYAFHLGFHVSLTIRVCGPLLYQWSPPVVKRFLKQFSCDLTQTLHFSVCFFHLLLFLSMAVIHTVILKPDWSRSSSSSILIMVLKDDESNREVRIKEVELRKRCDALRWLSMAKALLNTVLSKSIALIKSLLLMSGDVEENPGPGGS